MFVHEELAGDLAAAAMALHMVMSPDAPLDFAEAFRHLKFALWGGPSVLRRIAKAQSEAGRAVDALGWIGEIEAAADRPPYAAEDEAGRDSWRRTVTWNIVQARLGVADGVLARMRPRCRSNPIP